MQNLDNKLAIWHVWGMPKRSSKDLNQIAASILASVTEEAEAQPTKNPAAVALGRLGGLKGGKARAEALNDKRRSEIAKIAATARWEKASVLGAENMTLKWSKTLTASDAQQETAGALMPFLRFTKQRLPHNHTTWFRAVFFADAVWADSKSQRGRHIEEAHINVRVTILGEDLGIRRMRVDHDPARAGNHRAPTTHLHYDNRTRARLEATNLTGHKVVVKNDGGQYSLEIL